MTGEYLTKTTHEISLTMGDKEIACFEGILEDFLKKSEIGKKSIAHRRVAKKIIDILNRDKLVDETNICDFDLDDD
jgi:hypothetical protein